MRHLFTSLIFLVSLALTATTTLAQKNTSAPDEVQPQSVAKTLAQTGVKLFRKGEYDAAITMYMSAHKADPDPTLWYNLCRAHQKAGHYDKAAMCFRAYLTMAPKTEDLSPVMALIASLEEQAQKKKQPPQVAPPPTLVASANRSVDDLIRMGIQEDPEFQEDETHPGLSEEQWRPVTQKMRRTTQVAVYSGGLALALGVVGGYFMASGYNDYSDAKNLAETSPSRDVYNDRVAAGQSGRDRFNTGTILASAGLIAAITAGTALYMGAGKQPEPPPSMMATLARNDTIGK